MSWNNKVVWSEGLFLRPQHFQQQTRYLEAYVEGRAASLRSHPWGFTRLSFDQSALALGKIGIAAARGVFPDGTPFNMPDDDGGPVPLEVPENTRNAVVYLCLPMRRQGSLEIAAADDEQALSRYRVRESEVRDAHVRNEAVADVQVGGLSARLMLESAAREDYACMAVARIIELRNDKNLVLDEGFLPPVLDCHALPTLAGFIKELQGLLHHRGDALGGRVSASGRGGAAEIADFLLLQAVNRWEPLVAHLSALDRLHPERFYSVAVQVAGELATFVAEGKRPNEFPPYRHEDLQATFTPVMSALRQALSMVLEQNAIPIPLEERKYGIRVAAIPDRSLLGKAAFVLAVNANMPVEELRRGFPQQVKIGPVEQIRQLVNLQLPGIRVQPLPVAPRQLPYHAGFVYFELDRGSEMWSQLKTSGGFAMHVGGEFPDLNMEFWAIKG